MSTYFLFGTYQDGGVKNASAERTNTCKEVTTKYYVRKRRYNKEFSKPPPYYKKLKMVKFGRYNVYSISSKNLYNHCIKGIKRDGLYLVK